MWREGVEQGADAFPCRLDGSLVCLAEQGFELGEQLLDRVEVVMPLVRGGVEAWLQPLAVTPRQYVTLSLLRDERDQSSAELARKAGITPQSMSDTVATLTVKGLIERAEKPGRRRIPMTRLTAAGERLLAESDALVDGMEARLLAGLSASDLDALRLALRAIVKAG